MIGNQKTTIYLEHLAIAKGKILKHLKAKASRIKFLYSKPDITEADVKRINTEDEHIRTVLGFVDDSETTIAAIQEENQLLRERCEGLEAQKLALFHAANNWKQEYLNSLQQYQDLINTFQRVNSKNEAA